MKNKILLILLSGIIFQNIHAQTFEKAKLDSYFDALETNDKFMGSVAVMENDKIIYTHSVGFVDVEKKLKANENSKYRIGSISKTFTTVLILKAVEENKLTLDQTIVKFFPTIKNADKISVEDLLYHRSGIHNFTNDKDYLTWNTQPKTEKELVEIIAQKGSDFEPGTKSEYSNSNFVLLTVILEKSFNKPYPELLKKYITKPIGLDNTYYGGKINTANNECKSYHYETNWVTESETDMSVPLGAGAVVSTPVDLVKFSNALFGGKILNPESLEKMKTLKGNFGMGLFPIPFHELKGFGHTGGIDGFSSVFAHFDQNNVSYALTSNGTSFNNNNISIAVLSAVYHKPFDLPEFNAFQVNPEDLDKYTGVYVSAQIPLKITISKNTDKLTAQATGQPAFPLEPTDKDKFKFDQAGVEMEFTPADSTMILKQNGAKFNYKKE